MYSNGDFGDFRMIVCQTDRFCRKFTINYKNRLKRTGTSDRIDVMNTYFGDYKSQLQRIGVYDTNMRVMASYRVTISASPIARKRFPTSNAFIDYLINQKYIFRGQDGKLHACSEAIRKGYAIERKTYTYNKIGRTKVVTEAFMTMKGIENITETVVVEAKTPIHATVFSLGEKLEEAYRKCADVLLTHRDGSKVLVTPGGNGRVLSSETVTM